MLSETALEPQNIQKYIPTKITVQRRVCQLLRVTARSWGLHRAAAEPVKQACAGLH